jgi:hypothetical protein
MRERESRRKRVGEKEWEIKSRRDSGKEGGREREIYLNGRVKSGWRIGVKDCRARSHSCTRHPCTRFHP